jgi:3-isopropylmalate dehydrogenase
MLPGDGIGPEVMAEVHKLIDWIHRTDTSLRFTIEEDLIGGASLNAHGVPLTVDTLAKCQAADAVLLGAVGGPQWDDVPYQRRPESGLLELREALGVFANLRPAVLYDPLIHATPLKPEVVRGLDIVFVRELVGGIYFGEPRGITDLGNGERRAVDTQVYTTSEIRRIGRVAFELARKRKNRGMFCVFICSSKSLKHPSHLLVVFKKKNKIF